MYDENAYTAHSAANNLVSCWSCVGRGAGPALKDTFKDFKGTLGIFSPDENQTPSATFSQHFIAAIVRAPFEMGLGAGALNDNPTPPPPWPLYPKILFHQSLENHLKRRSTKFYDLLLYIFIMNSINYQLGSGTKGRRDAWITDS